MNRKLSVVLIIIIMLFGAIMGNTLAATSDTVAKLHASVVPNNPAPGGDVIIELSATEINEGIANISFFLDYDENIFTVSEVVTGEGWNQTYLAGTYFVETYDSESTTTAGSLITFHLKVKETATPGTETEVALTSIQAATEGDPVDFNDIKQTITIAAPTQGGDTSSGNKNETTGGNRNETTGGDRNETTGGNRNETTGGNKNETTSEQRNEVSNSTRNETQGNTSLLTNMTTKNETTTNGLPVQKVNQLENYTTDDKKPSIPQTGEDYGLIASIIGISLLSIVSFIIYRKNKI